jgi:uncharacterized protein (DUF58 family)
MSRLAGTAMITASIFLLVVAILLNSPHLFYMSTAMVATIAGARIQANLSLKGLRFVRTVPSTVTVGTPVTVEISAESEQKVRRPLMMVIDHLPQRLANESMTPSTPIAPAYGHPVVTRYQFVPRRRGIYRWSKLSVVGHDALGLVSNLKEFSANAVELTVLPAPIPVLYDVQSASGWGNSESEHGLSRGSGIEPRGIREYTPGDSMRYVHWRSTARTGQLVVKEFETGNNAAVAFIVQNSIGTEIGEDGNTTLELICGHLAHICGRAVRQGVLVQFPAVEKDFGAVSPFEREQEILKLLATLQADKPASLAEDVRTAKANLQPGTAVHLALSIVDPDLPDAIADLRRAGHSVVAMTYDACAFDSKRRILPQDTAVDPAFLDQLRAAGAHARVMPLDGVAVL